MAGAGHPPLCVLRADGRVEMLRSQCPPLGLLPVLAAIEDSLTLAPGDGFFLFTDGFYDVVDPTGARMDFDAFERSVGESVARPAQPFLSDLLKRLRLFAAGSAFTDDLAAVAAFKAAPVD